jgi:predicted methyltransferase
MFVGAADRLAAGAGSWTIAAMSSATGGRGAGTWTARALALALAAACAAPRATPPPAVAERGAAPELNAEFLSGDLDVARFERIFESESREIFRSRAAIVAALDLASGQRVADVGAGTGLFLGPLSDAVGPRGRVWAVDVSPRFVEHLRARVREEGLANVRVVRCPPDAVGLPDGAIERAFLCDTYHHFEHPAASLASLRAALVPGGELWVLDFERIPGVSRPWVQDHVRAGKEDVAAEIERAGFEPLGEVAVEGLEENYLLRFRRP